MNLWGVIRLALISIARNKMRSFLTALGIIIGVGSVVTMVGVGQGAYSSVQNEISKMGTSLIMIMPGSSMSGGSRMGAGTKTTLTEEDAQAIEADCPSVSMVSPSPGPGPRWSTRTRTGPPRSWVSAPIILASGPGTSLPGDFSLIRSCATARKSV